MLFSFSDYKKLQRSGIYKFPICFFPDLEIDRKKYYTLEKIHEEKENDIKKAFRELKNRVGTKYYKKVYPIQTWTLDNSSQSFPPYRFILPEVITFDWLAIVDWHKNFSRDHALHQPLTAYIVYKLLGGGNSESALPIGNSNLLDLCIDNILNWKKTNYLKNYLINLGVNEYSDEELLKDTPKSRLFWKTLFYETAFITATFHDLGYPWQYRNMLSNKIDHADYNNFDSDSTTKHIHDLFANRLIYYPFNGYKQLDCGTPCSWKKELFQLINKAHTKTHGLPGALGFLFLNDKLRKFPEKSKKPFHQFCVDWAALGIMMHDLGKIYWNGKDKPENEHMRLQFDVDPLSCIIALADVIEEFNRPSVKFSNRTNDGVVCEYDEPCSGTELKITDDELEIIYKYTNPKSRAKKLLHIKGEENEYFNEKYGYVDLSAIGIKKISLRAK
jgi:hypothetical protein